MTTQLKILSWNCNGISNKKNSLLKLLYDYNIDIICLQETHLQQQYLNLGQYALHRVDRNTLGGGLLIGTRPGIPYHHQQSLTSLPGSSLETLSIVVHLPHRPITLYNVYHPTGRISQSELEPVWESTTPTIITGDLNCHHTNFGSYKTTSGGATIQQLSETYNFILLNTGQQTHLHKDHKKCVLDLTWSSPDIATMAECSILPTTLGSDHYPVLITLVGPPVSLLKPVYKTVFSRYIANAEKNLANLTNHSSYESLLTMIQEAKQQATVKFQPQKTPLRWWNRACQIATRDKRQALYKARRSLEYEDWRIYRQCVYRQRKILRQAKREAWAKFLKSLTTIQDIHRLHRQIKNRLTPPPTSNQLLFINNHLSTNISEQAQAFLVHFTAPPLQQSWQPRHDNLPDYNELDSHFSWSEFETALGRTKQSAPGADGVTVRMITQLSQPIRKKIFNVINNTWKSGLPPSAWRHSLIVPILKPGKDPTNLHSYRPIALTSCISKVAERIILQRLQWLLHKLEYFNPNLYGFLPGRGAQDCLISLTEQIFSHKHLHRTVILTKLDLHQAYDSVRIEILLKHLYSLHIPDRMFSWLHTFLSDRTAQIKWADLVTSSVPTHKGLPQGAVLSPWLFNIYMNNIFNTLLPDTDLYLYADDIFLITAAATWDRAYNSAQTSLTAILDWCQAKGLTISNTKSSSMVIGGKRNKSPRQNFFLNSEPIPFVTEQRILGIIFDINFTWKPYATHLCRQGYWFLSILRILTSHTDGVDGYYLLLLIRTILLTTWSYGSLFLNCAPRSTLRKLQVILNQALRLAIGLPKNTPLPMLWAESGMPNLTDYIKKMAVRTYLKIRFRNNHSASHQILADDCTANPTAITRFQSHCSRYQALLSTHNLTPQQYQIPVSSTYIPDWIKPTNVHFLLNEQPFQKKALPPEFIQAEYARFTTSIQHDMILIAVDGSKLPNQDTGVGIYIPQLNIERSVKISRLCSVFSAECHGVHTALKAYCTDRKDYCILTDSKSLLTALLTISHRSHSQVIAIYKTILTISARIQSLTIIWIPGHTGIPPNEKADQLAKAGAQKSWIEQDYTPLEDVLTSINRAHQKNQDRQWTESHYFNSETRHIHPTQGWLRQCASSRKLEILISQLRTNMAPLNKYLHKIQQRTHPFCERCKVVEDTAHYLIECQRYTEQREILRRYIPTIFPELTFPAIMSTINKSKVAVQILERYIVNTHRFNLLPGR